MLGKVLRINIATSDLYDLSKINQQTLYGFDKLWSGLTIQSSQ